MPWTWSTDAACVSFSWAASAMLALGAAFGSSRLERQWCAGGGFGGVAPEDRGEEGWKRCWRDTNGPRQQTGRAGGRSLMENGKWTVGRSFRVSPAVFQVLDGSIARSTRTARADRPLTGRGKLGDPFPRLPVWGQVPISPLCRRPGSRAWQSRGLPAVTTIPKVDGRPDPQGTSLHAAWMK
jgi:hypothetical protein